MQTELNVSKKVKLKAQLMSIVDCYPDGHGRYTSNLVTFSKKVNKTNHFLDLNKTCDFELLEQKNNHQSQHQAQNVEKASKKLTPRLTEKKY